MMTAEQCRERMSRARACVIIPTFNNAGTVAEVICSVEPYCSNIVVVNDGSLDRTTEILRGFGERVRLVEYAPNRGKGYALSRGFARAVESGFDYAVTIDSDGQHLATDIPLFVEQIERNPRAIVVGSRGLRHENMPEGNTFANRFSNFWFAVQTMRRLPDTQSGFRAYPLGLMRRMRVFSRRYETELEILVRAAWRNVQIVPIAVSVVYQAAGERVSHFRKGRDFARISVLNTVLCCVALVYGYPSMLIRKLVDR